MLGVGSTDVVKRLCILDDDLAFFGVCMIVSFGNCGIDFDRRLSSYSALVSSGEAVCAASGMAAMAGADNVRTE